MVAGQAGIWQLALGPWLCGCLELAEDEAQLRQLNLTKCHTRLSGLFTVVGSPVQDLFSPKMPFQARLVTNKPIPKLISQLLFKYHASPLIAAKLFGLVINRADFSSGACHQFQKPFSSSQRCVVEAVTRVGNTRRLENSLAFPLTIRYTWHRSPPPSTNAAKFFLAA